MTSTEVTQGEQNQVQLRGIPIPQSQIFDIRTRSHFKPYSMEDIIQRLWLNQTPKFLIRYHQSGLFDKPEVKDVRDQVLRCQSDNVVLLARFHAVIKRIVDVAHDLDHQQGEVSWDGEGPLHITKQVGEGKRALPTDLMNMLGDP